MNEPNPPDGDISRPVAETSPVTETSLPPAHQTASWRSRIGLIASLGTGALALPALAGFAGRAWWMFALAGTFRIQYFWGFLLGTTLLLATGRRNTACFAAALLVVHGWLMWPFFAAPPVPKPSQSASSVAVRLRVVTLNVWARNLQYERVVDFLRRSSADIVVLEEVYPEWVPHLKTLQTDWPHHSSLTLEVRFGMAIFSRWPLDHARNEFLSDGVPVIAAQVHMKETSLAIFGVHLSRPLSRAGAMKQAQELAGLPEILNDKSLEQIIVGDFNSTSWNPRFSNFLSEAGLSDSRLGFGVQPSWPCGLPAAMRIPIDHCLVSKNLRVVRREVGPSVGSDHLPVIVDLEVRVPIPENEKN